MERFGQGYPSSPCFYACVTRDGRCPISAPTPGVNGKTAIGVWDFFPSFWSDTWIFGAGRSSPCEPLQLHHWSRNKSKMDPFYSPGKGNDRATVGHLLCPCFGKTSQPSPIPTNEPNRWSWCLINQPPDLPGACSN